MTRGLASRLVTISELMTLPQLVVFDLDDCLWLPEMYTLTEIPTQAVSGDLNGLGNGSIGARSGLSIIQLFPDALNILQAIHLNHYPGLRIAAASSADTTHAVRIAHAAMNILEVVPGVTMKEVFNKDWPDDFTGNLQIGRSPPLSSNKAKTHFPILRKNTGISYEQMLFFDDCNWGDNCGEVQRECPGVIVRRTPHGLTVADWNAALLDFSVRRRP